jgi:hypothetical protein
MIKFNEERHEYSKNGIIVPGVTSVLDDIGLYNYDFVDKETMDLAKQFGKAVHKTTELSDLHKLHHALDTNLKPCLNQWERFKKDFKVTIIEVERRVFSKRYFYCGTLDRILVMKVLSDEEVLLDIKTGCKMKSHAIQNSAYKKAIEEEGRKLGKTTYTLYLSDDNYKLEPHSNKNDINTFLSALAIYNFKRS